MIRYILVFAVLLALGAAACAAVSVADAPAAGQIAFDVSLGLFVAALAGGVIQPPTRASKQRERTAAWLRTPKEAPARAARR